MQAGLVTRCAELKLSAGPRVDMSKSFTQSMGEDQETHQRPAERD